MKWPYEIVIEGMEDNAIGAVGWLRDFGGGIERRKIDWDYSLDHLTNHWTVKTPSRDYFYFNDPNLATLFKLIWC